MHFPKNCDLLAVAVLCAFLFLAFVALPVESTPSQTWKFRLIDVDSNQDKKLLQALPPGSSSWGLVCNGALRSSMAQLICSEFGYSTEALATPVTISSSGLNTSVVYTGSCDASAPSLSNCTWDTTLPYQCSVYLNIAGVSCGKKGDQFTYEIAATNQAADSVNGTLLLRDKATGDQYSVCDHQFDARDANRACQSAGYYGGAVTFETGRSLPSGLSGVSGMLTHTCDESTAPFFTACSFTNASSWCSRSSRNVEVHCRRSTSTPEYRLIGTTSDNFAKGTIQARSSPSEPWANVCNNYFSSDDAFISCRSLGFNITSTHQVSYSSVTQSGYPFIFDHLYCKGSELGLAQCSHRGNYVHACNDNQAIRVDCSGAVTGKWQYRTRTDDGIITNGVGRLEVKPAYSLSFGTVCDDWFRTVDAKVACRSLGVSDTSRAVSLGNRGAGTGTIFMDNVGCGGSESELSDCSFSRNHNCGHHEDVWIDCRAQDLTIRFVEDVASRKPHMRRGRVDGAAASMAGATYAPICGNNVTDYTATVICRTVFGQAANVFGKAIPNYGGGSGSSFAAQNIICPARASNFTTDCWINIFDSSCSNPVTEALGVECYFPPGEADNKQWEFKLAHDSNHGQPVSKSRGLLMARPSPDLPFGVVCAFGFGTSDARAACRSATGHSISSDASVSFISSSAPGVLSPASPYSIGGEPGSSAVTYMRDVACSDLTTTQLWGCSFGYFLRSDPYRCSTGSSHVALDCGIDDYQVGLNLTKLQHASHPALLPSSSDDFDDEGAAAVARLTAKYPHVVQIGLVELKVAGSNTPQPLCATNMSVVELQNAGRSVCFSVFDRIVPDFRTTSARLLSLGMNVSVVRTNATAATKAVSPLRLTCGSEMSGLDSCYYNEPSTETGMCATTNMTSAGPVTERLGATCFYLPTRSRAKWSATFASDSTSNAGGSRGLLQVRPLDNMPFGHVCGLNFSSHEAAAACRLAGFRSARADTVTYGASETFQYTAKFFSMLEYMSFVSCSTSSTSTQTLDQCEFKYASVEPDECSRSHGVVIDCTPNAWEFRLVGRNGTVSTNYGRLELRPNSSAPWGTVASASFNSAAAAAACRSLGLYTPSSSSTNMRYGFRANYGGGRGPIYMTKPACSDTSKNLQSCDYQANTSGLSHDSDVGVYCTVLPSKSDTAWSYRIFGQAGYGRLEVRPSPSVPWGTVCNEQFGLVDASVACKSVGLYNASFTPRYFTVKNYSRGTGPVYMSSVNCSSAASRLGNCAHTYLPTSPQCSHASDIGIQCRDVMWEMRIVSPSSRRQLSTDVVSGEVQVRSSSSQSWGRVCAQGADNDAAATLCNGAGVQSIYTTSTVGATSSSTTSGTASPVYMTSLSCSGGFADVDSCSFTVAFGDTKQCPSSEGPVDIACVPAPTPTSSGGSGMSNWQTRVGTNSSGSGFVEVRPSASAPWGRLCSPSPSSSPSSFTPVSQSSAKSLCAMHGFDSAAHPLVGEASSSPSSSSSSSSHIVYTAALDCPSGATSMSQCSLSPAAGDASGTASSTSASGSCSTGYAATVDCLTSWQFRVSPANSASGRLEVRHRATADWGTVCSDHFGDAEATIACRSIARFSSASVGTAIPRYGGGSGTIYMDDVQCSASNLTSLLDCDWTWRHNCSHADDVGIMCALPTAAGSNNLILIVSVCAAGAVLVIGCIVTIVCCVCRSSSKKNREGDAADDDPKPQTNQHDLEAQPDADGFDDAFEDVEKGAAYQDNHEEMDEFERGADLDEDCV